MSSISQLTAQSSRIGDNVRVMIYDKRVKMDVSLSIHRERADRGKPLSVAWITFHSSLLLLWNQALLAICLEDCVNTDRAAWIALVTRLAIITLVI